MNKRQLKQKSLFRRVLMPLLTVLALQSFILYSMLEAGGVFARIHENAIELLTDRTRNKYQILQNDMNNWSSLQGIVELVGARVESILFAAGKDYPDIKTDAALNAKIVENVSSVLMTRVHQDNSSGIFLILDGVGVQNQPHSYAGMYVRDTSPDSHVDNNSDLHVLRGLPPLTRKLGLALDSFWKATFVLDESNPAVESSFFFKPLRAAMASQKNLQSKYFGYWSNRFSFNPLDAFPVITYSVPLIAPDGTVYGVLGSEMSVEYVAGTLMGGDNRRRELDGSYFLGITDDGGKTYRNVLYAGAKFKQYFFEQEDLTVEQELDESHVRLRSTKTGESICGAEFPLTTYNRNTVFSHQQWVLVGLQDEESLFAFERLCRLMVSTVAVAVLVAGVVVAVITARRMAKPVTGLVKELRQSEPSEPLALRHTGFTEIDVLADAVMSLHHAAAEEAFKISKIISMTGLSVGVFEILRDNDQAFCSDGFFSLLGAKKEQKNGSNRIYKETCERILAHSLQKPLEGYPDVYEVEGEGGVQYLRSKILEDKHGIIGTLQDVTEEIRNRRRIEHDRDYDLLTDIYNRRAFEKKISKMLVGGQADEIQIAALVMLDLDNLKSINDNYGHDCGDSYIRAFGRALHSLQTNQSFVARRSGDEFYAFFFGYSSKEELRKVIHEGWKQAVEQSLSMPDGRQVKLRASGGIAWYPDDTEDFHQLVHFADFAMYRSKNMVKGSLEEFSWEDYREDGFLFNGHEALNRLLENSLVRYVAQPVVSVETGEIFGYEFLMRSLVPELPTPDTILRLAREQGKLHYVERITWFKGLETAREWQRLGKWKPGARLFINSIANQRISKEDEHQLATQYEDLLGHVILEVTESENKSIAFTQQKLAFVRQYGGKVAIDDYGTGYNSDASLIMIAADYVKLDMSLVRDVDTDENKWELIRNLISYAKQRGIKVLAEGVETSGEMQAVIALGVHYIQGYYTGRPENEPAGVDARVRAEILSCAAVRG